MAKPFSIQAPENIAKEYAGNKQKIAQAAQMGIVDPTAAVLAGMFIDRMRSAQVMEAAQQPTVAQQVLGGQPPQGAPPAPQQGMGPPPQGMPMPPQGMGAPPPQQMPMAPPPQDMGMAPPPQGMAMGGLTTLPVPDAMFDEPENGSYAGGGMVAFASGGPLTDEEAWSRIKRIEGGLGPKGEMRVSSAGAVGPSQLMPATAPEAAKLAGLPWDEKRYRTDPEYNEALGKAYYLSRVAARKGDYNKAALDYHSGMGNVDKGKIGPAGRDYARKFSGAEIPERDTSTAQGFTSSLDDISNMIERRFAKSGREKAADEALNARAEEMASDEYYEKQRKDSMWETLANIGFNMASSKSPYLLQAVSAAAAAAMPGAQADKKERKQLKDRALNLMVANGAKDRKDAMEKFGLAVQVQQAQLDEKLSGQKLALDERQVAVAEKKLKEEIRLAGLTKPEDIKDRLQRIAFEYAPGTPEHEAAMRVLKVGSAPTTAANMTAEGIRRLQEGRTGGTAEGATAKDSDGKTIVFTNGQWMYP